MKRLGLLTVLVFSLFVLGPLQALSNDLACKTDGRLRGGTPHVINESPSFFEAGKNYPISVLSLSAPASWQQNFICFRYEVENTGPETIPLFYWKLMDDSGGQDLESSKFRKRVKIRPSAFKDPIKAPTSLSAFRQSRVDAQVWMSIEDAQRKDAKAADLSLGFTYTNPLNFGGVFASAVS